MKKLPVFMETEGLPTGLEEREKLLTLPKIEKIICFVLAPMEANIPQACKFWIDRLGINYKTKIRFGQVPEDYIAEALRVRNAVAVFWTCAVFAREHQVFFQNANTLPFFFEQVMPLDEMQLAAKTAVNEIPSGWRIASHVSPAPLVDRLVQQGCKVVDATSNGTAAQMCAKGEVELAIVTESARASNELVKVHSFGSPEMLFLGGITKEGARILSGVCNETI